MKKTLQMANGAALIVTIVINYLASAGLLSGNTVGGISARYETYFTPAGYAFSIWSVIYLGLAAFVIYQGRSLFKPITDDADDETAEQIGWWFVISCIANVLWIIAWVYDYIALSVLVMLILLFSLIQIIFKTDMELYQAPRAKIAFVWWPFALYSGWITVALIANIAAWLTKTRWDGFGISEISWTLIMIIAAAAINLGLIWSRNMREFALAGIWGLIAIAVTNWNVQPAIVWTAIIAAAILFVNIMAHAYRMNATTVR